MNTIYDLIEALGGNSVVAHHLNKPHSSTVSEMKRRGNIRVEYWPELISLAELRGIEGVTPEALMNMHLSGPNPNSNSTDAPPSGFENGAAPVSLGSPGNSPTSAT